jgi:phosphatidylglycerophosphatase GEP4
MMSSYCYSSELLPLAVPIVHKAKQLFPNSVAILSNSAGSCDDVDYKMAKEAEKSTGLEVIRHKIKKPACLDEVSYHRHFMILNNTTYQYLGGKTF